MNTAQRRSPLGEAGFTLIEVMIAMAISIAVIGALAIGYVNASAGVNSAQTETELLAVADQQIEQIRQTVDAYGFDALALTSNPSGPDPGGVPANPLNPNDYITNYAASYPGSWTPGASPSESYLIERNYNVSGSTVDGGSSFSEPLLVNGAWNTTSGVPLGRVPKTFSVTLPSGEVVSGHVYITQTAVPCSASTLVVGSCGADARRITVAVQDASPAGRTDVPTAPEYTSTIITRGEPANQQNLSNGLQVGVSVS